MRKPVLINFMTITEHSLLWYNNDDVYNNKHHKVTVVGSPSGDKRKGMQS